MHPEHVLLELRADITVTCTHRLFAVSLVLFEHDVTSDSPCARSLGRVPAAVLAIKFLLVLNYCLEGHVDAGVFVVVKSLAGMALLYLYLQRLPFFSSTVNECHVGFATAFCWIAFCETINELTDSTFLVRCVKVCTCARGSG